MGFSKGFLLLGQGRGRGRVLWSGTGLWEVSGSVSVSGSRLVIGLNFGERFRFGRNKDHVWPGVEMSLSAICVRAQFIKLKDEDRFRKGRGAVYRGGCMAELFPVS